MPDDQHDDDHHHGYLRWTVRLFLDSRAKPLEVVFAWLQRTAVLLRLRPAQLRRRRVRGRLCAVQLPDHDHGGADHHHRGARSVRALLHHDHHRTPDHHHDHQHDDHHGRL